MHSAEYHVSVCAVNWATGHHWATGHRPLLLYTWVDNSYAVLQPFLPGKECSQPSQCREPLCGMRVDVYCTQNIYSTRWQASFPLCAGSPFSGCT